MNRRFILIAQLLLSLVAVAAAAEVRETIPQTRNSPLIAIPERAKVSGFSAGATYGYSIQVPPGTGGATPSLTLTYSSLTKSTAYGYGWNLNLPVIERCTRFGAPAYDDPSLAASTDRFEIDGELMARDPEDPATFYRQAHDGSRTRYLATLDSWEVTQPDGTRMLFGSRAGANSVLTNGANLTGPTFRWALDEVVDPAGNSYRIDYEPVFDSSFQRTDWVENIYPRFMSYSFHESATLGQKQSERMVEFLWADRAYDYDQDGALDEQEDQPTNFRSGFRIGISKRLIEVKAGFDTDQTAGVDDLVRRYEFVYAPKLSATNLGESPFSKLVEILRYGSGTESFRTSLEYTNRPTSSTSHNVGLPGSPSEGYISKSAGHALSAETIDMNGDGVVDRINGNGNLNVKAELGFVDDQGRLQFQPEQAWEFCSPTSCAASKQALGITVEDTSPQQQGGTSFPTTYTKIALVDMDGDGRPDYLKTSPPFSTWKVRFNQGSSFGPEVDWSGPDLGSVAAWFSNQAAAQSAVFHLEGLQTSELSDVNGDGRPDHVAADDQKRLWVSINTGSGFAPPTEATGARIPYSSGFIRGVGDGTIPASHMPVDEFTNSDILDINQDGFPDIVAADEGCLEVGFGLGGPGGSSSWFQEFDTGSEDRFVGGLHDCSSPIGWGPSWVTNGITVVSLDDANGDGVVDYIGWNPALPWNTGETYAQFGLGNGEFSDVLLLLSGPAGLRVEGNGNGTYRNLRSSGLGTPTTLLVNYNPTPTSWTVFTADGPPEGLLRQVTNELGGVTTIEYKSSRVFDSIAATAAAESLPTTTVTSRSARWVPARITYWDGRTGSPIEERTAAVFAELRYDQVQRRDLGFRMAESEDATGVMTRSHFHQAVEALGKQQTAEVFDSAGALLASVATTWSTSPTENASGTQVPDSWLSNAVAELRATHDGGSSQSAMVDRTFDPTSGAPTSEIDRGADLIQGTADDRKTVWTYASNVSDWLMSYPREKLEYHGSSTDPVGLETFYYDGSTDPNTAPTEGLTTRIDVTYEPDGSELGATAVTDTRTWDYDDFGNPIVIYDARSGSFGSTPARTIAYDPDYNSFAMSVTNRLGHSRWFDIDPGLGEIRQLLDENGYLRCWFWDEFGRLERTEEAASAVASSGFPGSCGDVLADFQFTDVGTPETQHVVENLYPQGLGSTPLVSKRFFDGWGREHQNHAPGQSPTDFFITTRGWDSRGLPSCGSLPQRGASQIAGLCSGQYPHRATAFDGLARPTSVTLHTTSSASVVESTSSYTIADLDVVAGLEVIQDLTLHTGSAQAPDRVRRFGVDSRGQTVAVEESGVGGGTTSFRRDPRGRITQVDGPDITYADLTVDKNQLDISYDFLNRRTSVTPPGHYGLVPDGCGGTAPSCAVGQLKSPWFYEYDANGNLVRQYSPKGTQRDFHYDELNRLVLEDMAPFNLVTAPGIEDTEYQYDTGAFGIGRLASTREVSEAWKTEYGYYLDGLTETRTRTVGSDTFAFTYFYDRQGRTIIETYPDQSFAQFSYSNALLDSIDLKASIFGANETVVENLTYHAGGALETLSFPAGAGSTTTNYTYGADYRLDTAKTTAALSGVIQEVNYDFDFAGNLLVSNDTQGLNQSFLYDAHHRLIQAANSPVGQAYGTIDYAYDPAGNLTQMGDRLLVYGCSMGGPQAVTQLLVDGVSDRQYSYNRDGAVTSVWRAGTSTMDLTRNERGQVSVVDTGGNTSFYGYDEAGQRLSKSHATPGGAIVDRTYVSANYEVLSDGGSFKHTRHFFVGGRRVASVTRDGKGNPSNPGDPASETRRYYHPDQVGTNTLVTDEAGVLVQETIHTPYGRQHAMLDGAGTALSHSASTTRHLFTDQEYDSESELSYFGARFYDPEVGRFLSRDPEIEGATDRLLARLRTNPQDTNAYSYVGNRPTIAVDPDGRAWWLALARVLVWLEVADNVNMAQNATRAANGDADAAREFNNDLVASAFTPGGSLADDAVEGAVKAGRGIRRVAGRLTDDLGGAARAADDLGEAATGGRFGDLPTGREFERHHTPADSASPLARNDGPAVRMSTEDHRQTASFGNSRAAQDFRARQKELIDGGNFDEAFLMDVDDIQSKFGSEYDEGILDAMEVLPERIPID